MSTNDVPGANPVNRDVLAMGCWAEHDDGSLIFVESVEGGRVVYSIFDMDGPVEYRDAMNEDAFKRQFTWLPEDGKDLGIVAAAQARRAGGQFASGRAPASGQALPAPNLKWTWHDKTPFPWDLVMRTFPSGPKAPSGDETLSAAARVARSLNLRGEAIRQEEYRKPTLQKAATTIMTGIRDAVRALKP